MRKANNSKKPQAPEPEPTPKRRGRPPGAKDLEPRKNSKIIKQTAKKNQDHSKKPKPELNKLLKPDITTEPIFPRDGEKGVLAGKPVGKVRKPIRPLPTELATDIVDLQRKPPKQKTTEDLFRGASPEVSEHKDWQAATAIERRFCYEYFASGFRLVDSFRTIAGDLGEGTPEEVQRRAKMYVNRAPIVKALKVLVEYFLQDRKIAYAPKILAVLEAQAFYDPADLVNGEGELIKNLSEIEPHLRWCIKGIETKWFGKDADRSQLIVTLVDRNVALEKLAKYIQLFAPDTSTTINVQNNVQNVTNHILPEDSRSRLSKVFEAAASVRRPAFELQAKPAEE